MQAILNRSDEAQTVTLPPGHAAAIVPLFAKPKYSKVGKDRLPGSAERSKSIMLAGSGGWAPTTAEESGQPVLLMAQFRIENPNCVGS